VCVCEKIAIIHLILSPIGLKMPCHSDLSCVILLAKFYARRKILALHLEFFKVHVQGPIALT